MRIYVSIAKITMGKRDKSRVTSHSVNLCAQMQDIEYSLNNPTLRENAVGRSKTPHLSAYKLPQPIAAVIVLLNYDTSVTRKWMHLISSLIVQAMQRYTIIDLAEGPWLITRAIAAKQLCYEPSVTSAMKWEEEFIGDFIRPLQNVSRVLP